MQKLEPLDYLDIEIHTPHQVCEHCEKMKGSVELQPNPFAHDIYNECRWEFICKECYTELCNDI